MSSRQDRELSAKYRNRAKHNPIIEGFKQKRLEDVEYS